MEKYVGLIKRLREYIIPEDAEIQVAAFNILAICGIVVSILTAIINFITGNNTVVVIADLSGVFVSLALIVYCHKTGNGSNYTALSELDIITLDDAVCIKMKNDAACLISHRL